MSNKCRGSYTIKGEGAEALVREMNNRAKRHETSLQDASGNLIIGAFCDITPILGPKWDAGSQREPVYFAGRGEEWPLVIKDGQAEFWAETRTTPPVDALCMLSELYPVEITLSYSLQCNNWMNGRTLRFYQGKVTQVRYGDFVLAEDGQPIHHWIVECQGATVSKIKEAGIKILDDDGKEPSPEADVHVTVRNADIMQVRQIPGVGSWLPYTLDEERYVLSLQTDLDWGMPRHPHGDDIKIVERPIALVPSEVSTLYGMLVDMARSQAQPGQPSTDDDVPVTEVELARFGRYYGDISTWNKVFHPTAREINLLKACVNDERWKELQDALGKPAWTECSPQWEEKEWEWKRVCRRAYGVTGVICHSGMETELVSSTQKGIGMMNTIHYEFTPLLEKEIKAHPELGNVFRRCVQDHLDLNRSELLDTLTQPGYADTGALILGGTKSFCVLEMADFKKVFERAFPNSDTVRRWEAARQSGTWPVLIFPNGDYDSCALITLAKS